jgi:hypothetical protein
MAEQFVGDVSMLRTGDHYEGWFNCLRRADELNLRGELLADEGEETLGGHWMVRANPEQSDTPWLI